MKIEFYFYPDISYIDYNLRLYIDGKNLCEFEVNGQKEEDFGDISYLADWFKYNWRNLINNDEFHLDIKEDTGVEMVKSAYLIGDKEDKGIEWIQKHSWKASGTKIVLPEIIFRRKKDKIEISWDNNNLYTEYNVEFINKKGVAYIDIDEFKIEILKFIKHLHEIKCKVNRKLKKTFSKTTINIYREKEYNEPIELENEMLKELKKHGYGFYSIYQLILLTEKEKKVIPIILKYINLIQNKKDRETLVRFLGVRGFNEAVNFLIREFYKNDDDDYRLAIANTLSLIQDENLLDELIKIIRNESFKMSRVPIIYRLYKYRKNKVKKVLEELLNDENLKEYAEHALERF